MGEDRKVVDIMDALDKREKRATKKTRTRSTEPKKKVKKATKKEQQIIDIAEQITLPDNYFLVNTEELLDEFVEKYKNYKNTFEGRPYVYVDTETYGVNTFKDPIISISVGFDDETYYNIPMRPFKHPMSFDVPTVDFNTVRDAMRPLFESDYDLVLANAK